MPHISTGSEQLHYVRFGHGSKVLLAFHGYGQEAETFQVFEPWLAEDFTILSIDLPYHGQTEWAGKPHLTADDLAALVQNARREFGVDKVSLMGYSIGGRVALSIMKAVPEQVDKMVLMATDGLIVNGYYFMLMRTQVGRMMFRGFLGQKDSMKAVLSLKKAGIIKDSYFRLATQVLHFENSKRQLLHAWPCLSRLIHTPAELKRVINKYQIPVTLVMGARDTVLPPRLAYRFAKGVPTVAVCVLERGHRIFDTDNAQEIAQHLL
ncbi:MAG: alpha/beta hydrolase [Taibaiella sp.]|nr:alpha/beta hydrolase [Taibaiella sp.]